MAAPPFVPVDPVDRPRAYASPDYVPVTWSADRPAAIAGRQPSGPRLGSPGPDQGYAMLLAERMRNRLQLTARESVEDALAGCLLIALRRASLFGRAPVVHDLTIAATIWGFLDSDAPADLVEARRSCFDGVANVLHHYSEGRALVDAIPEATLRMSPQAVASAYPARWRELVGA